MNVDLRHIRVMKDFDKALTTNRAQLRWLALHRRQVVGTLEDEIFLIMTTLMAEAHLFQITIQHTPLVDFSLLLLLLLLTFLFILVHLPVITLLRPRPHPPPCIHMVPHCRTRLPIMTHPLLLITPFTQVDIRPTCRRIRD